MAINDFGSIRTIFENAQAVTASRSTGPVYNGITTVASQNLGDSYLSNIRKDTALGNSNKFIWGVHRWGDVNSKVD